MYTFAFALKIDKLHGGILNEIVNHCHKNNMQQFVYTTLSQVASLGGLFLILSLLRVYCVIYQVDMRRIPDINKSWSAYTRLFYVVRVDNNNIPI